MDPLSPWTYAKRNARKILPTIVILTFVVTLVILILTLLSGLKDSTLAYTREFDRWTVVFPKKDTRVSKEVRERILACPAVERLIDSRNCFMRVKTLIGPVPYQLRAAREAEMPYLLELAGARLKDGRLPAAGTSEVALHENLMKANGWPIGREFGMEVDDKDWMPGRFRVVGVLEGPVPLGLSSAEYLSNPLVYAFSAKLWERLLVVAKAGRTGEMNHWLRGLPDVKVYDKIQAVEDVSEGFDRILLILNFVSITLIVVVSVVVGMIQAIFFGERMGEFAILLAIGHARRRLLRKVSLETAGLMAVSWAAGAGLALATLALFRALVLAPMGVDIPLFQPVAAAVSLSLPAVAHLFATVTVTRRLRALDPVAIIERRG
jgi:putative ABC transport system permease protein